MESLLASMQLYNYKPSLFLPIPRTQGAQEPITCDFQTLLNNYPNLLLPTSGNTPTSVKFSVYLLGQNLEGNICNGTGFLSPTTPCPAGYVCSSPSNVTTCPKGYYCKPGTATPRCGCVEIWMCRGVENAWITPQAYVPAALSE
jgi:hypothetical protein